ncbi:hypothetical protein HanHA300_Chr07g0260001 [Helianthus annuus]|nr:hypothetical protein HanHA300_Chr07g0260001 [Helianthus annuus]
MGEGEGGCDMFFVYTMFSKYLQFGLWLSSTFFQSVVEVNINSMDVSVLEILTLFIESI